MTLSASSDVTTRWTPAPPSRRALSIDLIRPCANGARKILGVHAAGKPHVFVYSSRP